MIKNIISNIRNIKERGFTLVEILVSVGLITILGAAITATVISISTSTSSFTQASMTQSEAAETVSEMTRDISAATKINYASDYRVDLTTQEDNNSFDVSYFYWNPDNPERVTIPSGVVSSELPNFPAIMQLRKETGSTAPGVLAVAASGYSVFYQDRTLFIYYDANNSAISPTPINTAILPKIVRVDFGFSLKVEDRPARIELASSATPRYSSTDISPQGEYAAIEACPTPTVLGTTTVTAGTKNVVLNWSIPAGFNSKDFNTYTIYREGRIYGKQKASPMVVGVINSLTTTTYTDTEADWGETYKYYVVLGCTIGTSDPSGQYSVTVPPEQPKFYNINSKQASLTELQTKASGDVISGVTTTNPKVGLQYTVARGLTNQLVWEKVNGALGYYLYHNGTFIQRFGANTTTYQDYGRPYGNIGDYTLIAYNIGSNGTGGNSLTSATARLISPPAKSAFTVTALDTSILSSVSDNKIDVTTRASNTTGYKVYKVSTLTAGSTCAYADRAATLDFTGNTKTDAGVNWGTWTCYKLVGYNDAGDGEKSDDLIAKQKPGKFSITSVTGGWHRYYATGDYSANGAIPLPGQAQCWYGGVDEYCDNAPTYASLTLYTNDTADKTNINIVWSSATNAYGDYTLNQTRVSTGGIVDQAPEHGNITVTAPYNGNQQSWAFGNQMPGTVYSHTVTAKALSGESRVIANTYVSNPDIPHYVEVRREEQASSPRFRRSVNVYAGVLRGLADSIFVQLRTNSSPSGPASVDRWLTVTNSYQVAYGTTFEAPYTGGITVKTTLTRNGQTRQSLESGMDGLYVVGSCTGSAYASYTPIPDTKTCYINGAAIRYYSGGRAASGTSQVGDPSQLADPLGPTKPVNPIPEPQANCGTIYESDPAFTQVYGCQFGTGIPSAPSYAYLKTISGVDGTIAWNSVPYATGYTVKVTAGSTTNNYNFSSSVTQGQVPLVDGALNIVTVTAKNNVATSVPSPEVLIDMPEVPQNLVIKTVVGKEYTVEWDRPLVEETTSSYKITMVSSGVTTTYDLNKPTTGKPTIKITVPSANPGGTISVQAINPNVGADDNTVATSRPSTKLVLGATEAPANLRLVSLTNQTAKLAWDAPFGAVTYKLTGTYTGPVAQVTNISTISGIATTTYDLTNIPYARTVTLNVQSTNGAGDSIKSNTLTFDVLPPAPTGVNLTSSNALGSTITTPSTLQWTTATCAVGTVQYKLSRVTPNATTIRDYGNTNYVPIAATGGTETTYTQNGITYKAHTFTTNGTFTVTNAGNNGAQVDYLIIGGGGSGGQRLSGGGGAGGVLQGSMAVSATAYPIVIGAGGRAAGVHELGFAGGNTTALGLTALGGGGGGAYNGSAYVNGSGGGSGGGGGAASSAGAGTAGQGFQGGNGNIQNWSGGGGTGDSGYAGGGGGGAGGPGTAGNGGGPTFGLPGYGGPGIKSDITGTERWYAGGGGGQQYYNTNSVALGGSGVGGNGASQVNINIAATAGAANTGSGGGAGGHYANEGGVSGAGGSGIVVIRYKTTDPQQYAYAPYIPIQATGGTVSESTSGAVTYRTHTFTSTSYNNNNEFKVTSLGTSNGRVSVLVVAGGGGGGMDMGGGGGGGGVVYNASVPVSVGTIPVYVGKGGFGAEAGSTAVNPTGYQFKVSARQGANSSFGTSIVAIGGGPGGSSQYPYSPGAAGGAGGSGGGASGYSDGGTRAGGAGTAGQGYAGGNGGGQYYGGGGGGAGGVGASATAKPNGGSGILYADISPFYFGGGGGASAYTTGQGGDGGIGGGGGGANGTTYGGAGINNGSPGGGGAGGVHANTPGGNGGANTGGGGGGGAHFNANNQGGDGGSGIVIVKYEISNTASAMHLPGTAYTYKIEVKCVEGNFTSPITSDTESFTAVGTTSSGPTVAPTVNTPGTPISASGGNSVYDYTSGGITYRVHKFTGSGTFTISSTGTTTADIDALIVAGGGGGGSGNGSGYEAGGGGAGGLVQQTFKNMATGSYAVTVGGGGAVNVNGGNSSFNGVTAIGGGRGAAGAGAASAGGSGGGNAHCSTANGAGTAGQGYAGQKDPNCSNGGGGGGAGEMGGTDGWGSGGDGIVSAIDGTSRWYAGGGAACAAARGTTGSAGDGGGGTATCTLNGAAGNGANGFGGGGGGAYHQTGGGGVGGSGTVILRYVVSTNEPYAGVAHKVNVTSTGQCTTLHPGSTPLYNYYRNGVKFATDTTSTSAVASTVGNVGDVVTYEYTVRCRGTYNGVTYTTAESAKSPIRTVTLTAIPTLQTTASGGAMSTYTSGGVTYQVHKFTSNGTFTINSVKTPLNTEIDYLIVGGGGGGGAGYPGGAGGAGGFLEGSFGVNSTTASIPVTVGGGGYNGGDGGFSRIQAPNETTTAYGGGGGGMWYAWNNGSGGRAGASGGGGSTMYGAAPGGGGNAYASQGFGGGGGMAWVSGAYVGGGGGGAAGGGGTGNRSQGGNGGSGRTSSIDGTSRWYAGGGASGYYYEWGAGVANGTGGNGGGGNPGASGTANTGGGGGAASTYGGSGIVIFRFPIQ